MFLDTALWTRLWLLAKEVRSRVATPKGGYLKPTILENLPRKEEER
jgi:hypothetical protein